MKEVSVYRKGERTFVDISKLKRWAINTVPVGHPLRTVIDLETDHMPADTFLAKMDTWLKLSKVGE